MRQRVAEQAAAVDAPLVGVVHLPAPQQSGSQTQSGRSTTPRMTTNTKKRLGRSRAEERDRQEASESSLGNRARAQPNKQEDRETNKSALHHRTSHGWSVFWRSCEAGTERSCAYICPNVLFSTTSSGDSAHTTNKKRSKMASSAFRDERVQANETSRSSRGGLHLNTNRIDTRRQNALPGRKQQAAGGNPQAARPRDPGTQKEAEPD